VIFLTGFVLSDSPPEGFSGIFYLQQLKILSAYTVFGLVTGGLGAGILARKKKKYAYFFENEVKKYSIYFIKCFSISALIIFVLVSRELINNPLLFEGNLLNRSFWFHGIFSFIKDKFSPMYFTVFFGLIIAMSIHNLSFNLSIYQGAKRIAGYSAALIFSVLLIFNFGYLNANSQSEEKNIVFMAVEGLKNRDLRGREVRDMEFLKTLLKNSYVFGNFYSPVKEPRTALLTSLTSLHPEKGGYLKGNASFGLEKGSVLNILKEEGYNTGFFSDADFTFNRFEEGHESKVSFAGTKEKVRSEAVLSHFIMPVIFNNRAVMPFFSESRYLEGYRDDSFVKNRVSELIGDRTKPFFFVRVISDLSEMYPYPYYRLAEEGERAGINYLNDEIGLLFRELEKNGRRNNTIICLYGLPERGAGLKASDYRVPFVLSYPEYDIERSVKNEYSLSDIVPTVLDAAGIKYREDHFGGVSFFAPEFVRKNIFLTDITPLLEREDIYFSNADGFYSKNIYAEREIYPMMQRSLIRGDYKLDITPTSEGPVYKMYDLSKDAAETDDISGANPVTLRRMRNIYEEKMNKDFNFRIINGHALK
jgi:arylsulfatase A-like enzyme